MTIAETLLPHVLSLLSRETRALIAVVVELARSADELGPPVTPANAEQWCRDVAADRVPWQLIAAAVSVEGAESRDRAGHLVENVETLGLVPGVRLWSAGNSGTHAERILLAFLALTARQVDPAGLEALQGVFQPPAE